MVEINGNEIRIAKGDRGNIIFKFTGSVNEGDSIKMVVAFSTWMDAVITKTGTLNSDKKVTFAFTGDETNISPGKYAYAVRVVRTNGHDTPIKTGSFVVEEVAGQ